jgi:dihydrofolate reductase
MSISLDGYVAGPDQGPDDPVGVGGPRIEMKGGTTFHFVTDGSESALAQAVEVAGGADVDIAGGASAVRQALAAGAVDELVLDVVPVLLGQGERLFDGVADPGFTPVEVVPTPYATHLRYRVGY